MQDKLRISYFIGSYSPELMGNAGHEEVIRELRRRGLDVEVLTLIAEPDVAPLTKVLYDGVPVYRINVAPTESPLNRLSQQVWLRLFHYEYFVPVVLAARRFWREHKYDLIHAEAAYPYAAAAMLALRGQDTPLLVNVQGADVISLPDEDYGFRRFRLPRILVGYTMRHAAANRAISPAMVPVQEQLSGDPKKVLLVPRSIEGTAFPPPGVDLMEFRAQARRRIATRHGLDGPEVDRPWVMSLSRLHPFKGLEYLVGAMPELAERLRAAGKPAPRLWLVGPSRVTENYGDYGDYLQTKARELGVADMLVFTGRQPHEAIRDYLAAADVLVTPSVAESLNRGTLEGAAVGTPPVVSARTGVASYLEPRGACLTFPARSASGIAEAVARLLIDKDEWARISANARATVELFRTPAVATRHIEVYKQLTRDQAEQAREAEIGRRT